MDFLKKHKKELMIFIGISIVFFALRLYNILSLPIFTDEAIYIRWSQIAKNDAAWRFISLTDGKQPMFVWLTMIAMRVIRDPLLAGRIVSVFAGFLSLIGIYFLGKELFKNKWVGLVSSALYLIFPMSLVYDRMALYDTLVGTFSIWSLYFTVLLVRTLRLDVALVLGMVIGGGVLTKASGFFSIYLLPFSLLIFDFSLQNKFKRLVKLFGLAVLVVVLAQLFYLILRLSPFFHIINEKNTIFVYPFKEWLTHPFTFFVGNWKAVWDWFITYTTWPIFILIISSFFISRTYTKEKLMLLSWFLLPALTLALFGNTLYPRFILFMILSLLPLAAFAFIHIYERIKNKILFVVFCLVVLAFGFRADYLILSDFAHAPIPLSDLRQYNNDWPAGGGTREAVVFFQEQAKKGKIYIGTEGTFGLMPYALEIYLVDNPNIKIEGFWPVEDTIPKKVLEESKKIPTYFVFYQPCIQCSSPGIAPSTWKPINLIYRYDKISERRYFSLYQILQ